MVISVRQDLCVTTIYNWLVVYLPLWKIWVRQLGWWNSQYVENKIHVPNHQPVIWMGMLGYPHFLRYIHNYPNVPKPPTIYIYTAKYLFVSSAVCDRMNHVTTTSIVGAFQIEITLEVPSLLAFVADAIMAVIKCLTEMSEASGYCCAGFTVLVAVCFYSTFCSLLIIWLIRPFFFFSWMQGTVDPAKRYQVWWWAILQCKLWGIVIWDIIA